MNDKDKEIINSYKQGKTPEAVKQNVTNQNGKVTVKDGKVSLHEGVDHTHYEDQGSGKK